MMLSRAFNEVRYQPKFRFGACSVLLALFCAVPQFAYAFNTKFTVTTTKLSANSQFDFFITALGEFEVDCGSDGKLEGEHGVSGKTITRTEFGTPNESNHHYWCSFLDDGVKTIKFSGLATDYSGMEGRCAICFNSYVDGGGSSTQVTSTDKIASISGSLGAIFPTISNNNRPNFSWAFKGATHLEEIPKGLFSGVTSVGNLGFLGAFQDCSSLTTIPDDLFGGINTASNFIFQETFSGCTHLSGYISKSVFAGLLANGSQDDVMGMFNKTFWGTQLDENCPNGTIPVNNNKYKTIWQEYAGRVPAVCTVPPTQKPKTVFEKMDIVVKAFPKDSAWRTDDGTFNTTRLKADAVAGVVLGTIGGVITSNVVKANQVEDGLENLKCAIDGQNVAVWGDEFVVGLKI